MSLAAPWGTGPVVSPRVWLIPSTESGKRHLAVGHKQTPSNGSGSDATVSFWIIAFNHSFSVNPRTLELRP